MATIYEATDHLLIHADYGDPAEHRHMAAHILLSLGDAMEITSNETRESCRGILIPSGVSHKIQTGSAPVLVFLFDSTTHLSAQITRLQTLPDSACQEILRQYRILETQDPTTGYRDFLNFTLGRLGLEGSDCPIADSRIREAMDFIRAHAAEPVTCQEIADAVFLSQSRFSHLFREQVGMTVPAYLIYQRLMFVYAQVIRGKSVTQSALEAGFSSSAHFADVSRRVFGLSATQITGDLRLIRVQ